MNLPELGVLEDVDVRMAWAHEAHGFTPWLAEHLDALSAVIGIPLEMEGREVAVEPFYADILARNPQDGSLVLIENQLDGADHGHLGQILTYLAGLGAHTVVWIASSFREAHLSALKWLNEHTSEPFAFFAVRVKAVRIGNSPIAPVFEIIEKPNEWERQLQAIAKEAQGLSGIGQLRKEFWEAYIERFPDEVRWGPATATSNRWRSLDEVGLVLSLYLAHRGVGVFVRGPRGQPKEFIFDQLLPHAGRLEAALGTRLGNPEDGYQFSTDKRTDTSDRSQWPELMDWLHNTANLYQAALTHTG